MFSDLFRAIAGVKSVHEPPVPQQPHPLGRRRYHRIVAYHQDGVTLVAVELAEQSTAKYTPSSNEFITIWFINFLLSRLNRRPPPGIAGNNKVWKYNKLPDGIQAKNRHHMKNSAVRERQTRGGSPR